MHRADEADNRPARLAFGSRKDCARQHSRRGCASERARQRRAAACAELVHRRSARSSSSSALRHRSWCTQLVAHRLHCSLENDCRSSSRIGGVLVRWEVEQCSSCVAISHDSGLVDKMWLKTWQRCCIACNEHRRHSGGNSDTSTTVAFGVRSWPLASSSCLRTVKASGHLQYVKLQK